MKQLVWYNLNETERLQCLKRPALSCDAAVRNSVAAIIDDVRQNGDVAVKNYTRKFDGIMLDDVRAGQISNDLDSDICRAIDAAYQNIRAFHERQGFQAYAIESIPGMQCQRIVRPIERVGLYVPGGSAPLVSTTLMLGVPAQLAGCKQIIMCTPCDKSQYINPYILYAAALCGIQDIFKAGGAQAIAAMAYGTETILKVDKIFGPGNAYVTEAKNQVARDADGAAIDMPAGPSEVCVIANESTNPAFAAVDLLSQAEHDAMSQVLLIGTSPEVMVAIQVEVNKQLQALPRQQIAQEAIKNSFTIIADDMAQAIEISNIYAPEHLILCFEDAEKNPGKYLSQIKNAGSVFLGPWTPEAMGDYASGPNHVLPTYGYARNYSGLGVEAFQKTMTVQQISQSALNTLGPVVETLAKLEGLQAHANAISIRVRGK